MKAKAVLVTTKYRGVFFGYTTNPDAETVVLTGARCCLYWSSDVGGFYGLAGIGPTSGCRISPPVPGKFRARKVTSVSDCTPQAEAAWKEAPVQGHD